MSGVNKEIGLYPMSGDMVRFVSTAKLPIGGFETELHPIQDLHGQEYPYPAGGVGTNIFENDPDKNIIGCAHLSRLYVEKYDNYIQSITRTETGFVVTRAGTKYVGFKILLGYFKTGDSYTLDFECNISQDFTIAVSDSNMLPTEPPGMQYNNFMTNQGKHIVFTAPQDGYYWFGLYETTTTVWTFTDFVMYPTENICPITGHDSMNIYVSPTPYITDETKVHTIEFPLQSPNQWDEELEFGYINDYGEYQNSDINMRSKNLINITPSTSYYVRCVNAPSGSRYGYRFYDKERNYISGNVTYINSVITSPSNAYYMGFYVPTSWYGNVYNHNISINYPATETGYYPYKGRTVYEGTLTINEDGTGQIVSKMASVDLGTLNWTKSEIGGYVVFRTGELSNAQKANGTSLCSNYEQALVAPNSLPNNKYVLGSTWWSSIRNIAIRDDSFAESTQTEFKSAMNGVQLVYELAEPLTLNLTVEQIETLIGFNYVWNNVGTTNITFQYYTGGEGMAITFLDCWTYPKAKLDEMFKAVDDRLDALEEASTQASADSNAKTTTIEPKEIATEPVAEREGDE